MMIQSLLHNASVFCCLVLFLAPVVNGAAVTSSEQAAASPSLCSVCGINQKVGSPDSIFEFPGQVGVNCGALETAGEQGEIPMAACPFLSAMIADACNCYHIGGADEQHEGLGQEDHIINENPKRTASCSVCGSEQRVSIPDGIVNLLGYSIWTCAELESAGEEGLIPQGQCYFLAASIKQVCGCRRIQIGYTASYRELNDTLDNRASATMPIFTPTASLNLSPSTAPTSTIPMSQPVFYDGAEDDIKDDDETSDFQRGYKLYLIISMVGLTVTVCCLFLYGTIHQNDNANNSGNQRAGLSRRFPVGPSVGNQQEMIDNRFTSGDRQQDEQDPLEIAEDSKLRPLVLEVLFPEQKVTAPNREGDIENTPQSLQSPCPICLELFDVDNSVVFGSSCSHIYHRRCILQWLDTPNKKTKKKHEECPSCRQRMWDFDTYGLVKEQIKRVQMRKEKKSARTQARADEIVVHEV